MAVNTYSDPLRLCQYLMRTATSRGVKLHINTRVVSVIADESDTITAVKLSTGTILPCTKLLISAGPWTAQVFHDLFPLSRLNPLPIAPLAGYSFLLRSPRHGISQERDLYQGRSHAVFASSSLSYAFSPEIFSRQGGEIYIAGLNDDGMPLPATADDSAKHLHQGDKDKLRDVAVQLMGKASPIGSHNVDDLEIFRESICFRPVSTRGRPVVSPIKQKDLGGIIKGDVFVASGHGPWGISLSLGTGMVVSEMIRGLKTSVDVGMLAI